MKIITIVLTVLALNSVALAEEAKSKKKIIKTITVVEEVEDTGPTSSTSTEEKSPIVVQEEFVLQNSSAHNRMDKKYVAWAQLVSIGPYVVNRSGLAFGYYLNRNNVLFLDITGGSDESDNDYNDGYDVDEESIGFHWKHFNGNSFYFNAGMDFRKINYVYTNSWSPVDSRFKATAANVSFSIGNQWQWDNFTLGCDWLGLTYPLFRDISESKITTADSYYKERFEDEKDDYTKKVSGKLLSFYLGYSF